MGRPGIITGGIAFLVALIFFATDLLPTFWKLAIALPCVMAGFLVMWYSIPKEKRFRM